MPIEIVTIPLLQDNYAYLLHAPDGHTVVVDPSEGPPVQQELARRGWHLSAIWNTHHHADHVGGNAELKRKWSCRVLGSRYDERRIPVLDTSLQEGSELNFGGEAVEILEVPGHTLGAIAFYLPRTRALFTGDTLFLMGCGRLFEGTPDQMWSSLSKLARLPADTRVYCGHEYAESNARFALTVEPENGALRDRAERIRQRRTDGHPSVPGTLAEELATNPFVRAGNAAELGRRRTLKDAF